MAAKPTNTSDRPGLPHMTFSEAKAKTDDSHSGLKLMSFVHHIALSPRFLQNVRAGIREQLNDQVNKYNESTNGVLVAYSNVKALQHMGMIIGDDPYIHFKVCADAVYFQPQPGTHLRGVVNKVGKDHIGCLVHGIFNVSLRRPRMDCAVKVGDNVSFQVLLATPYAGLLAITGKLDQNEPSSAKRQRTDSLNTSIEPMPEKRLKKETTSQHDQMDATYTDSLDTESKGELDTSRKSEKKRRRRESKNAAETLEQSNQSMEVSGSTKKKTKTRCKLDLDNSSCQTDGSLDVSVRTSVVLLEPKLEMDTTAGDSLIASPIASSKKKKQKNRRESEINNVTETSMIEPKLEPGTPVGSPHFETPCSSSKKKKKRKSETANGVSDTSICQTPLIGADQSPIVEPKFELDTPSGSSKKKKKTALKSEMSGVLDLDTSICQSDITPAISTIDPKSEIDTMPDDNLHTGSLSVSSKKKKRKRKKSRTQETAVTTRGTVACGGPSQPKKLKYEERVEFVSSSVTSEPQKLEEAGIGVIQSDDSAIGSLTNEMDTVNLKEVTDSGYKKKNKKRRKSAQI